MKKENYPNVVPVSRDRVRFEILDKKEKKFLDDYKKIKSETTDTD